MLTLAYWWVLALLPLPLIVWWLAPAHREPRQGVIVPFLGRLATQSGERPSEGATVMHGGWWRAFSLTIVWIATVAALARPQVIEPR